MTVSHGIVTLMLRSLLFRLGFRPTPTKEEAGLYASTLETQRIADIAGYPYEWLVCPHCGQQSWRFPPHSFEPCPLVVSAAESAGLKIDAERAVAIRMGVQLEEATRMIREHMEEGDDDTDEDE